MTDVRRALGPQGFGSYQVSWESNGPHFEKSDLPFDGYLVPGLVDIHIHGAYGIDFMSASQAEMLSLCQQLAEVGYEFFLPTTVTASQEDVLSALKNLPDSPMVPGFHLEGPFVSPLHPGAQPPQWIVTPQTGLDDWEKVLSHPLLRVVTLAPEEAGGFEMTRTLSERGVTVSIGHSDATIAQAHQAHSQGAAHTTHTYNAMRGLHHREPGLVGFALTCDAVRSELIFDRIHVTQPAADVLFRCKGDDNVIAVSDSSAATGLSPGARLTMWGHDCVVDDKSVRLASNGALAGSAVTLYDCFQNIAEDFGIERAIKSCSSNPRQALKLPGPQVWLDLSEKFEIRRIVRAQPGS